MITIVHAKTIPDAWYQLLFNIFDNGYHTAIQSGSFEKEQVRLQYPGIAVEIECPDQDMWNFIPEGSGIASPIDRDYVENHYFPRYLMSGELQENETYTYGSRINELAIPDAPSSRTQLSKVIDMLTQTPLTNQAVIEIAKPSDIFECYGKDGKLDPPCLRLIDFKVVPRKEIRAYDPGTCTKNFHENILTMSVYFRSWDLWAGFPSNLCGLELLKQYVASEAGLINGPISAYSAGLHIYGYQDEIARLRVHRNR